MNEITPDFLGRLFDRHAAALELYARQWAGAPADIVQEAFLKLARQTVQPDRPVAWMYRVVRNAAISAARSDTRRKRNERSAVAKEQSWFASSEEDRLDANAATEAIAALADEEREVIVAKIWGGLTFEEFAEVAGISSSTAHRRYESALASLRERLGVTWLTKINSTK